MSAAPDRRAVLAGAGLCVAFALARPVRGQPPPGPALAGDLAKFPMLDSWIRLDATGRVTVFTGKVEFGQGIKTALIQIAAEELDVSPADVTLVTADTARTPDEGLTAGSHSVQDSGGAILNAAANVRMLLIRAAAARWSVEAGRVKTRRGKLIGPSGQTLSYGALAASLSLHVAAQADAPRKVAADFQLIGRDLPRTDIPAKLTGGAAYVQDLRPAGMLHARVVRSPSEGTSLKAVDEAALKALPGYLGQVRQGRFQAVVAETEWTAIQALRQLEGTGWTGSGPDLPADVHAALVAAPAQDFPIFARTAPGGGEPAHRVEATYTRPYLMHGSIGPSCAVALWADDGLTVWTHSQGVGLLQKALAPLVGLPAEKIRCIHMEGAGCYGHNGADDVAADAALVARGFPGRPIRLQWMREQEHGWEPLGSAMAAKLSGAVSAEGRIVEWRHDVWSNPHNTRPFSPGFLLAAGEVDPPIAAPAPKPIPLPEGDAHRNGEPLYVLPNASGALHYVAKGPVRTSSLRSLGAHVNVFAIESFMDELALAAAMDPLDFRLAHTTDTRAREAMTAAAARFGWSRRPRGGAGKGCGFGFARYKNLAAYCAVAVELDVDRVTGRIGVRRVVAAVDCGQAVNPDGVRNQIEGAIVQSLSWTTLEAVAFDRRHRTSADWSSYPILRFEDAPDSVEVEVLNRPGAPFLGAGEAGQGPAAAAVANAVADAWGVRVRALPLSPERLRVVLKT